VMIKSLFLLSFILILNSCSKVNVAYDLAPRFVTNNLDENFDFSSERYDKIKTIIAEDFKSNRGLLKDEVLARVNEMAQVADQPQLRYEQVEIFVTNIRSTQKKLMKAFEPSFSEVILKMKDEELKSLVKETNERHEKAAEKLKNKSEFIEKAYSRFETNMEFFFDEVTPEQKKIYLNLVEKNWDYFHLQLEHRRDYLKKFQVVFSDKEKLLDLVYKYYAGDDSIKTEKLLSAQDKFFKDMYAACLQLWSVLNESQKKYYKKSIAQVRSDLEKL
jgi:hypothetical protein